MMKRIALLLILCTTLLTTLQAAVETRSARLQGSQIASNAVLNVQDDKYSCTSNPSTCTPDFVNMGTENYVQLRWTGGARIFYNTVQTIDVTGTLTRYTAAGAVIGSPEAVALQIVLDPQGGVVHTDQAVYRSPAPGYRTVFTVGAVTINGNAATLPADVLIESSIKTTRYYNFNQGTAPVLGYIYSSTNRTLDVHWNYVPGAVEYDLEWYFVNYENPGAAVTPDMDQSTRVSVSEQHYVINTIYDKGTVFLRVRAVFRGGASNNERRESVWSNQDSRDVDNVDPYRNWTYSIAYAEDGKHKEVVSYFDGSGRNRQSITLLNSENVSLIGEQYYDYEGRAALSTLPAPSVNFSNSLKFYESYTLNAAGQPFTKKDFDNDAAYNSSTCLPASGPQLSAQGGASRYYSPNNNRAAAGDAFNVALPDAKEYPYVMTVFDKDGRAKMQSGPGVAHAMGSGHETQVYYARPMQDRIDRLFGTEAGYAGHYSVEYVRDANGQLSVVYKDLAGRVIATALTGEKPAALDGLQSYNAAGTLVREHFDELNSYDAQQQGMVMQSNYMVEVAGETHEFHYELTPAQYTALCGLGTFACKYKLVITIFDNCNNAIQDNQGPHVVHSTFAHINPNNLVHDFTVTFPHIGIYRIEKKLVLDQDDLANYQSGVEQSLPGTCGHDLAWFQSEYAATIDQSECQGLAACSTYCTTEADRLQLTGQIRIDFIFNCQSGCVETTPNVANCDVLLDRMVSDLSPGGQYFDNIYAGNTVVSDSWLSSNLWGNANTTAWTLANFRDANGNLIQSWSSLRSNWQPGFASQSFSAAITSTTQGSGSHLFEFHPEFCHYEWCVKTQTSKQYDGKLLTATTYAQANVTPINFDYTTTPPGVGLLNNDPYFAAGGEGASQYSAMDSALSTIYSAAVTYVNSTGCTSPYNTACNDLFWQTFRRMYLQKKYELMDLRNATVYGCSRYCDNTTPPDAVADNCNSNPSWVQGFQLLAPDLITPLQTIANSTDPAAAATTYGNSLIAASDVCKTAASASFEITTVSTTPSYQLGITINSVNITGSISGNFGTPAALKTALVAAINAYVSTPDYVAVDNGAGKFSIYAGASEGSAANGRTLVFTSTNGSATISHLITGCATSSNYQLCGGSPDGPCPTFNNCFCDKLTALVSQWAQLTPAEQAAYASQNAYIAAVLTSQTLDPVTNQTINPAITATQVANWRANCTNLGYPEGAAGQAGTVEPVPALIDCNQNSQPCTDDASLIASWAAQNAYNQQNQQLLDDFTAGYTAACFQGVFDETFWVERLDREHHYTLYYYDQAGSLTRTVPPKGVNVIDLNATVGPQTKRELIALGRQNGTNSLVPAHTFVTKYKYDSYGQLVWQSTPDGGTSQFWYDQLGRIRVSQNAKQAAMAGGNWYSYTTYDALGRIVEVGQLRSNTTISQPVLDNEASYLSWVAAAPVREQVTKTYYDVAMASNPVAAQFTGGQQFLRKRVATVTVEQTFDGNDLTYDYATHYSYDVHGNVNILIQEYTDLARLDNTATGHYQRYKKVEYSYDLISGNVNEVAYQKGQNDEFRHRYAYDADNRVTNVYTSRNGHTWDQDAKYDFYLHGPMARTEIGDRKVQGMDYFYTIQGWIKGVNAAHLNSTSDLGNDGSTLAWNQNMPRQHQMTGADAYGFVLQYFTNYTDANSVVHNDYEAVTSAGTAALADFMTNHNDASRDLYNGNIKAMGVAMMQPNAPGLPAAMPLMENAYKYDQLNRLLEHKAWTSASATPGPTGTTQAYGVLTQDANVGKSAYYNAFSYDADGNILTQKRNGTAALWQMDQLTYNYQSGTNKLTSVTDALTGAPSANYDDDLESQAANNYGYDQIGNLVSDASEGIASIEWNVYGKIKSITRVNGFSKTTPAGTVYPPDLEFGYDAMGQRVLKIVKTRDANGLEPQAKWKYTYYVRDAAGNVLTTYNRTITVDQTNAAYRIDKYKVDEWTMYGASRLGIVDPSGEGVTAAELKFEPEQNNTITVISRTATAVPTTSLLRKAGEKIYELANHLGNVLVTVTDRLLPVQNPNALAQTLYYSADVKSATDYSAFGAPLAGRTNNAPGYKHGFNGKESDAEINGSFGSTYDLGERIFSPSLGRFFSTDPLEKVYTSQSPYAYCTNSPIARVDVNGAGDPLGFSGDLRGGSSSSMEARFDRSVAAELGTEQTTVSVTQTIVSEDNSDPNNPIKKYMFIIQMNIYEIDYKAEYRAEHTGMPNVFYKGSREHLTDVIVDHSGQYASAAGFFAHGTKWYRSSPVTTHVVQIATIEFQIMAYDLGDGIEFRNSDPDVKGRGVTEAFVPDPIILNGYDVGIAPGIKINAMSSTELNMHIVIGMKGDPMENSIGAEVSVGWGAVDFALSYARGNKGLANNNGGIYNRQFTVRLLYAETAPQLAIIEDLGAKRDDFRYLRIPENQTGGAIPSVQLLINPPTAFPGRRTN
jgi:RHS repeat-associated protein